MQNWSYQHRLFLRLRLRQYLLRFPPDLRFPDKMQNLNRDSYNWLLHQYRRGRPVNRLHHPEHSVQMEMLLQRFPFDPVKYLKEFRLHRRRLHRERKYQLHTALKN